MKKNFKQMLTLIMVFAMLLSLMAPALAEAESDTWSEVTTTYSAGDYTFGKISHPDSGTQEPDGLVDYLGNGQVGVSGTVEGADGQGDRGQSYSWSAMAYGDYIYVGTCYAAMGQTLSAMDTLMGHDFDEEVMRAELNAIFNGSFFYGQDDGVDSKSVFVKVNVHTGEITLLMAKSLNGIAPQFRNAILYNDKLYFCGSVNAGTVGLPSIYEIDPKDDSFQCVYQGLSNMSEYMQAYKNGVCTGIRGMAVYDGKLVISNVGVDGAYLLISDNPSEGFTKIATQQDLYDYPAIRYVDSVYGGGIWEIVEFGGSLYVAMCSGTPETRVGDNMRSFAIVRGDCSGDWNDPDAWTWTPLIGDKDNDGAKYTFGIDPERTRAAACNMCIYDGYLYIGEYNDEEIPLEELMFEQDFGFLARNLEQSVNLYRMDTNENIELIVGEPTEMFPDGGILCDESGFGDYENQYFWQSKVFDGKLFLGTFDTSSLLHPLGQFTNGDLLRMSRDEWASQINYLKVLLKLLLASDDGSSKTRLGSALTEKAAALMVDEAADGEELSQTQRSSLIRGLLDGSFSLRDTLSTLSSLRQLNDYLDELTDLVETNDIAGFAEIYEKALTLYESIKDKLSSGLNDIYGLMLKLSDLENMNDLLTCLAKLSTAKRGFGLYTIESVDGQLVLETLTRDGFGDPYNHGLRAFATNDEQGWMVIGTANPFMGTQLWRTVLGEESGETETETGTDIDSLFDDIADLIPDFKKSIAWAYENGITSGVTENLFAPSLSCTRAQVVTFLWRQAGSPESDVELPFTDVSRTLDNGRDNPFYTAICWAYENNVTKGATATEFAPDGVITRASFVTMLWRYLGQESSSTANPFSDVAEGSYCYDAIMWALENGVTSGVTASSFAPSDSCTRAQVVTFLCRAF